MTESRRQFDIIVATSLPNPITKLEAIGEKGRIPWSCPDDLRHFQRFTTITTDPDKVNAIIMGRRTWNSLEDIKRAPLHSRFNCVITSNTNITGADANFPSLSAALEHIYQRPEIESIFVIGGGRLYDEALQHPDLSMIVKTVIHINCPKHADTFFSLSKASHPLVLSRRTATHESKISHHIEFWQCKKKRNDIS